MASSARSSESIKSGPLAGLMNPRARAWVPASALFLVRPRLPHRIHRIGSWKRGAAGSGELQEPRAGRDSRARDSTQPESESGGDATSSELARQAKSRTPWAFGTPGGTDQAPRPPLHGHRIRNGEIVNEGFVGPLAGRVNRRTIGRVGWRTPVSMRIVIVGRTPEGIGRVKAGGQGISRGRGSGLPRSAARSFRTRLIPLDTRIRRSWRPRRPRFPPGLPPGGPSSRVSRVPA